MYRAPNSYWKDGHKHQDCVCCGISYDLDLDYSTSEPPFHLKTWIDETRILTHGDRRRVEELEGPYIDTTCITCYKKKQGLPFFS